MKLSIEDQRLLEELCLQNEVDQEKVLQLLKVVQEFEFKERRKGIYDALKVVLINNPSKDNEEKK